MTEQERIELDAENDGYRNEFQRAFAYSSMTREPDDARARAVALAQAGRFVAVEMHTEYCRVTDAFLGTRISIRGHFATRAEAEAVLLALPESFWSDSDSHAEVWPHAPSAPAPTEADDDIPF